MDMRSSAHVMPGNNGVESHNAILFAGLNTAEHCVVELALVGYTAGITACDTTICALVTAV